MITRAATPELDMNRINSSIEAALAMRDNKATCAALRPVANSLIAGYKEGQHPAYITLALTVIEQIAAHNEPYAVTALYNSIINSNFSSAHMVQTSISQSLGQLCKRHPADWDLRGIAFLIETSRSCFSRQGHAEVAEEFCSLAVKIATASAQTDNPQLESMAALYSIAKETELAGGLMAEAAKQSSIKAQRALRTAKAPTAAGIDYPGISALFCTSIDLHYESLGRGETGCTPSYASKIVTLYLAALERWRLESPEKRAEYKPRRPAHKIPRHDLEIGYTGFSLLQNLGLQHAAKQDHAEKMAKWLSDGARGEAPKTAWIIAQKKKPANVTPISKRLSELGTQAIIRVRSTLRAGYDNT